MSSIRKPKRLIIRGDDEKDHMFLVKGGEDLRLDQRIEQVSGDLGWISCHRFGLLIFLWKPFCFQKNNPTCSLITGFKSSLFVPKLSFAII